jgi:protein TonB
LLQPSPVSSASSVERLRIGAGRRALAVGLALLAEGLLLFLLLTFSATRRLDTEEEVVKIVDLTADAVSEEAPEPDSPEPAQRAEERPVPRPPAPQPPSARPAELRPPQPPQPPQPAPPNPVQSAPAILPTPQALPPPSGAPRSAARPSPPAGRVYGPPDTGGSAALRDTERVGTAPNGEPLYAAAWHREPRPDELRAYLSTARGPGWGLIACRTAPNYRVEDCVALDEYPQGSQINRAILAAAWEFQVRPPRRGGQSLVGSWVRIRIDYRVGRR